MTNYDLMLATPPTGFAMTDRQQDFSKACSGLSDDACDIESKFYDDMPSNERAALLVNVGQLLTRSEDLAESAGLDSEDYDDSFVLLVDATEKLKDLLAD